MKKMQEKVLDNKEELCIKDAHTVTTFSDQKKTERRRKSSRKENTSIAEEASMDPLEQIENGASGSKNKKVKNATITYVDGIKFLSKLEAFFYAKCKELDIKCIYEPWSITMLEGFEFNGKKYRPITYKPDFTISDFNNDIFYIIECKGFATDAWPLRKKLILNYLRTLLWSKLSELALEKEEFMNDTLDTEIKFIELKSQKEINAFLLELKNGIKI